MVVAFANSAEMGTTYYSASPRYQSDMDAYIILLSSGDSTTRSMQYLDIVSGGGVIDCQKGVDANTQTPISKTADEVYEEFYQLYGLRQGLDTDEGKGDGLWDFYETKGFLATNGNIYHCDPTKIDTDGDGISDGQEAGSREPISVKIEYGGIIYLNGSIVDESNPVYALFASYGEGTWCVYNLSSNPEKQDTDGDYANDDMDSYPMDKNPMVSACFYDKEHEELAKFWGRYERKNNKVDVVMCPSNSVTEFKKWWNDIALDIQKKISYKILNVHMNFHGSIGECHLGPDAQYLVSETWFWKFVEYKKEEKPERTESEIVEDLSEFLLKIGELEPKTITGTLYLDCCQSGRTEYMSTDLSFYSEVGTGTNLAVEFLRTQNSIGRVRAWDGVCGTYFISEDELLCCVSDRQFTDIIGYTDIELYSRMCIEYWKNDSGEIVWDYREIDNYVIED